MATAKYLLSLPSRHHAIVVQLAKRNARSMGTLAYQYLHCQHDVLPHDNKNSNERTMSTRADECVDWMYSSPETAIGSVNASEYMTMSDKIQVLESQGIKDYTPAQNHANVFDDATTAALMSSPESALGSVHASEFLSMADKTKVLESQGMQHKPAQKVSMFQEFFDNMTLMAAPETATGSVHSSEYMSLREKEQLLELQGLHHKPLHNNMLYQEFIDHMALMASPESAAGVVSIAGLLDEESKAMLSQFELPKTLDEALADPRAVVVTSINSPFDIVDVNDAWVGLCGYNKDEAKHQNLGKLLQGPDTNADDAKSMVDKLRREHYANALLTNYTKQGRKFQNRVQAGLLSDSEGRVKYFVGVLEEIMNEQQQQEQSGKKMAM